MKNRKKEIEAVLLLRDKQIETIRTEAWITKQIEKIKNEANLQIMLIRANCHHNFTGWQILKIENKNTVNFEKYSERECLFCGHKEVKIDLT